MRRIRAGCVVADKNGRIGVVGYAPYSVEVCQVFWERRLTHDVTTHNKLTILLTKKQAMAARKILDYWKF